MTQARALGHRSTGGATPRAGERATPHPAPSCSGVRLLGLVLGPRKRVDAGPVGQRPTEPDHLGIQLQAVITPADGEPTMIAVAIGLPALDSVASVSSVV